MRPGGDIQHGAGAASVRACLAAALLAAAAHPLPATAPAETFPLEPPPAPAVADAMAPAAPPAATMAPTAKPPMLPASLPLPPRPGAATDILRGEFTYAAGMLDTWNAIGQILVRLDGVEYEGRAQMLGIYVVRYEGRRLLVLTRALVLTGTERRSLTRVYTMSETGAHDASAVAAALLGELQRRLPEEMARIAAGERGKPVVSSR